MLALPLFYWFSVLLIWPGTCMAEPFVSDGGEIRGVIRDHSNGYTLPGATISLCVHGILQGTQSDINGNYKIKPLEPGVYDLVFSITGYGKKVIKEVLVTNGSITFLDMDLLQENNLPEVEISTYREPLIRRDDTGGLIKISQEEIKTGIARDINDLVAQTAKVYQKREGGTLHIRGSRENATKFYVDGIKVWGSFSIPKCAIQEISVITGGVPAQYGDATGGIVLITTKSAFNR